MPVETLEDDFRRTVTASAVVQSYLDTVTTGELHHFRERSARLLYILLRRPRTGNGKKISRFLCQIRRLMVRSDRLVDLAQHLPEGGPDIAKR